MKITPYTEFIVSQYQTIMNKYGLKKTSSESGHKIDLKNDIIVLTFVSFRYDDGIAITLTDRIKNHYYYNFPSLKGFDSFDEGLDESEKFEIDQYTDDNKAVIHLFRVFLEKHCQDMLSGDFSEVGPRDPN